MNLRLGQLDSKRIDGHINPASLVNIMKVKIASGVMYRKASVKGCTGACVQSKKTLGTHSRLQPDWFV